MVPELLAPPPSFGLEDSVPTQQGDVYAFGLVTLQVSPLRNHHLPVFPDVPPGPDGRGTVSWSQTPGTRAPRIAWRPPGETCECKGYRDLRPLVGPYPGVLGWRQDAATTDLGGCGGSQ